MLELTPQQRRSLRAKAHHLDPVVSIGQHGLTPPVMQEIDRALAAHELVKVRVHSDDRDAREAMLANIADQLGAAPVQHLGKLLIVWRPAPQKEAVATTRATKASRKKPVRRPQPSHDDRQPLARRARGAGRPRDEGEPAASERRRGAAGKRGATAWNREDDRSRKRPGGRTVAGAAKRATPKTDESTRRSVPADAFEPRRRRSPGSATSSAVPATRRRRRR